MSKWIIGVSSTRYVNSEGDHQLISHSRRKPGTVELRCSVAFADQWQVWAECQGNG